MGLSRLMDQQDQEINERNIDADSNIHVSEILG